MGEDNTEEETLLLLLLRWGGTEKNKRKIVKSQDFRFWNENGKN